MEVNSSSRKVNNSSTLKKDSKTNQLVAKIVEQQERLKTEDLSTIIAIVVLTTLEYQDSSKLNGRKNFTTVFHKKYNNYRDINEITLYDSTIAPPFT